MLAPKRQQLILDILKKNGEANVEELAARFSVVPITIRRDLMKLERNGLLERSHGGAVAKAPLEKELLYDTKKLLHQEEKQQIALAAAELVREEMTVILDAGTTTYQLIRALKKRVRSLNIITTDLKIAMEALDSQYKVYFSGGMLQNETGCSIDFTAVRYLNSVNADIAFLAASGISPDYYITTPNTVKSEIKASIMKAAARKVLLADSSKFYKTSLIKVAPLKDVHQIISDRTFSQGEKAALSKMGVELIGVPPKSKNGAGTAGI